MLRLSLHIVLFVLCSSAIHAQYWPDSPVFRDYRPQSERGNVRSAYLQQVDLFFLERDASAGDPLSQHELGVRYLTGRGLPPDTARAALWLERAAGKDFTPALYNYGMLLANGWGAAWNPIAAAGYFHRAAKQGMPEAQFVIGVFFTDDLIYPQNWESAYYWMSLAADQGHEGARRAKAELEHRGNVRSSRLFSDTGTVPIESAPDSARQGAGSTSLSSSQGAVSKGNTADDEERWSPLMLDFSSDRNADGLANERFLSDFIASIQLVGQDSARLSGMMHTGVTDTSSMSLIRRCVLSCNPEALLLFGRLHEEGVHVTQSNTFAAQYFIRASWHESPLGLPALGKLLSRPGVGEQIFREASIGDPAAGYVAAALRALEIDKRLGERQALDLLKRAMSSGMSDALVQLGLWYVSGRIVERDLSAAISTWHEAANMRNTEARIRLAAMTVLGESTSFTIPSALSVLEAAAGNGSLLATTALATSYERGIGRSVNKGEAASLFREAAIRGSRSAYAALRRMYTELRTN